MPNKLAVAVILFNPEQIGLQKVLDNISSYASTIYSQCNGKIFIVDNSPVYSEERFNFFSQIPGSFYYNNQNKAGIAGAQNYACKKAIEDGYDWIMTMDQDSIFDESVLKEYLNLFFDYSQKVEKAKSFTLRFSRADKDVLSFSEYLRFNFLSPIKRRILKSKSKHAPGSDFWDGPDITFPVLFVPASANIINLSTWEDLGGFDESLFIDQVDNDFSIRLIESGYKIVRFNTLTFSHLIGERRRTIFYKHTPFYNSFRLFYIFRNHLVMYKRYPKYRKQYREQLKWYIIEKCIFNFSAIKNIVIFVKAYNEYKKMTETTE